jgi:hypothetical protein
MGERYVAFRTSDPNVLAHLRAFANKRTIRKEPSTEDIIRDAWKGSKPAFVKSLLSETDVVRAAHFLRGQDAPSGNLPPQQPQSQQEDDATREEDEMQGRLSDSTLTLMFAKHGLTNQPETLEFPVTKPQTLVELYTSERHGVESMKKICDVTYVSIDRRSLSLPQQLGAQPAHILPQTATLAADGAFECPEWKPLQASSKSRIQAMKLMSKVTFESNISNVPSWVAPTPQSGPGAVVPPSAAAAAAASGFQQSVIRHDVAAANDPSNWEVRYPANPYKPPPPPPPSTEGGATRAPVNAASHTQEEWSFTHAIRARHTSTQQKVKT